MRKVRRILRKIIEPILSTIVFYLFDFLVRFITILNKSNNRKIEAVVRDIYKPYLGLVNVKDIPVRPCPICGTRGHEIATDIYSIEIVACSNCGFNYIASNFESELVQQIFEKIRTRHIKNDMDGEDYWKYKNLEEFQHLINSKVNIGRLWFKRLTQEYNLNIESKENFLDIGAADGTYCFAAKKEGFSKAIGVEFDSHRVSLAQKYIENNSIAGVELLNKKFEDFNSGCDFNLIRMNHVLEHLTDPLESLKTCKRILNKKGFLYIEVPNMNSYSVRVHKFLHRYYVPLHINYFTPGSLKQIVSKAGFRIVCFKSSIFTLGTELLNYNLHTSWTKYSLHNEIPLSRLDMAKISVLKKLRPIEGLINNLVIRNEFDGLNLIMIVKNN